MSAGKPKKPSGKRISYRELRADAQSRRIPTWPYHPLWPVVFRYAALSLVPAVLIVAAAVWKLSPWLPPSGGLNSISHFGDPRPFKDYTRFGSRAMAFSSPWAAIATDQGITVIHTGSRIPRDAPLGKPALDVSQGSVAGQFLVLDGHGGILKMRPSLGSSSLDTSSWIRSPSRPDWPVPADFPGKAEVVAADMDDQGMLLAVRKLGVARYAFGKGPGGKPYRLRDWHVGGTGPFPLDTAAITGSGAWLLSKHSGIRYLHRRDMAEWDKGRLGEKGLARVDAPYGNTTAAAFAPDGRTWFHPGGETGWLGPFFGVDPPGVPRLRSPGDVRVSRLSGVTALMGTAYGLFAYHLPNRRILSRLPGESISHIEVGPRADGVGRVSAIGSNRGLTRLLVAPKPGDWRDERLDEAPVTDLELTDQDFAVYRIKGRGQAGAPAFPVRVLNRFSQDSAPANLAPDTGWRDMPEVPSGIEIASLGDNLLFGTDQGAFVYLPGSKSYWDCSRALPAGPRGRPGRRLHGFRLFQGGGVLAIADEGPYAFVRGSLAWKPLDPLGLTRPIALGGSRSGIVGLDRNGVIFAYADAVDSLPSGHARDLEAAFQGGGKPVGDVASDGRDWKLAFLLGRNLTEYLSRGARMTETVLPDRLASRTSQIAWQAGKILIADRDGILWNKHGVAEFGGGGLPFSPAAVEFIRGEGDSGRVWVGGPGGVFRYDWRHGSWARFGERWKEGRRAVWLEPFPAGALASDEDHKLWWSMGQDWTAIGGGPWGYDGNSLWVLGAAGLERRVPGRSHPSLWKREILPSGEGMRTFVEKADLAWPLDSLRTAFAGPGLQVGAYGPAGWQAFRLGNGFPGELSAHGDSLLAASEESVYAFESVFSAPVSRRLAGIPHEKAACALSAGAQGYRAAFGRGGELTLMEWKGKKGVPEVWKRGQVGPPPGFDPGRIIAVYQAGPDSLVLADETGWIAGYGGASGRWQKVLDPQGKGWILLSSRRMEAGRLELVYLNGLDSLKRVKVSSRGAVVFAPDVPQDSLTMPSEPPLERAPVEDSLVLGQARLHFGRGWAILACRIGSTWVPIPWKSSDEPFPVFSREGALWSVFAKHAVLYRPGPSGTLAPSKAFPWPFGKPLGKASAGPASAVKVAGPNGGIDFVQLDASQGPKLIAQGAALVLARQRLGGYTLSWSLGRDGVISGEWSGGSGAAALEPLWSRNRLALDDIRDFRSHGDSLYCLTPMGLVLRHGAGFGLRRLLPGFRNAHFASPPAHPRGPELRLDDGTLTSIALRDGTPPPVVARASSGPWKWILPLPPSGVKGLSILSEKGEGREWIMREEGWIFADDRVSSVDRDRDDSAALRLSTSKGAWDWIPGRGRLGRSPDRRQVAHRKAGNAAVQFTSDGVRVSARTFDGNPSLAAQGRFFFDWSEAIAVIGDTLAALAGGRRCVVLRRTEDPSLVVGCVKAPPDLAHPGRTAFASSGTPLLFHRSGSEGRLSAWKLTAGNLDKAAPGLLADTLSCGRVAWMRRAPDLPWEPMMKLPKEGYQGLADWWHGDRFPWDVVLDAGAVGRRAALVTAAGVEIWRAGSAEGPELEDWIFPSTARHCVPARDSSRLFGLVLEDAEDRPLALLHPDPAGGISAAASAGIPPYRSSPVLHLGSRAQGVPFVMSETWKPDSRRNPRNDLQFLVHGLPPGVPLLRDGQFVFDRADLAVGLGDGRGEGREWVAYIKGERGKEENFLCLNKVDEKDSGINHMMGMWTLRQPLDGMRGEGSDGLIGLVKVRPAGKVPAFSKILLEFRKQPSPGSLPPESASGAFRSGSRVRWNLQSMAMQSVPAFPWEPGPSLAFVPDRFFPLDTQGRAISFSFDRFSSIALDGPSGMLSIGTAAGCLTARFALAPERWLDVHVPSSFRFHSDFNGGRLGSVRKVRAVKGGFVLASSRGTSILRTGRGNISTDAFSFAQGMPEAILAETMPSIAGVAISGSNDFPARIRRPIGGVIDVAWDDSRRILWMCDAKHGLFRFLPGESGASR